MILERLEIQGFKSFAEKVVLEFPRTGANKPPIGVVGEVVAVTDPKRRSITAIVGPNGSGKSNISDAIKWVLGEQSMKAIRGKKSEDIIFSGSDKKARLGFAEVSMYLKNEDAKTVASKKEADVQDVDREIDPSEFSELVITRRLYRDGESQYLINRQEARLQDISLLLAKAGFGQKSYQIIGQGMIDAVLMATPLERKSFFDDAVGIKPFQMKRETALRQMERTESNLWQAEMLLKELEPRLRSLTRQVKRLEQREQIQNELKGLQKKYYGHQFKSLADQLTENLGNAKSIEAELAKAQVSLDSLKTDLSKLEQDASRSEIFNKLQGDYQILVGQKNNLIKEQTILRGKQELDWEKQGQLNLGWLYRREEELKSKIAELVKQVADLGQVFIFKNKKLSDLADQEKKLAADIKSWEDKIKQQTSKIQNQFSPAEWSKELEQVYVDLEKWIKELTGVTDLNQIPELKKRLTKMNAKLRDLTYKAKTETDRSLIDQWSQHLSGLLQEKERLTPLTNGLRVELAVLNEKKFLLENENVTMTAEFEKTSQKIKESDAPSDDRKTQWAQAETKLATEVAAIDEKLKGAMGGIEGFNSQEQIKKENLFRLEKNYQEAQNRLNLWQSQLNENRISQARFETRREALEKEIAQEIGAENWKAAEAVVMAVAEFEPLFAGIQKCKAQLELIGGIDPETVKEYKETKERHEFLDSQLKDLSKAMDSLEKVINELDVDIKEQFNSAFNKISHEFAQFFKTLFGGGQAKLSKIEVQTEAELAAAKGEAPIAAENPEGEVMEASVNFDVEEKAPERESRLKKFWAGTYQGVEIYACPPGKKLASINMLSGGERALASLALIAAIIHVNPAPFIVFDEVDAALDEANSHRMSKIISTLADKSQFVLITHNRSIMHSADVIYGVTMGLDGVSKLLSVKLEQALQKATRL